MGSVSKRKIKNVKGLDRNSFEGWKPFVRIANPPGADDVSVVATFQNNKYGVMIKESLSPTMTVPAVGGGRDPMPIAHLVVIRLDGKGDEIPWDHKQRVVNEILGMEAEAVELFPSEARRIRGIKAHQCHLWAFPPGTMAPVGLIPKAVVERAERMRAEMELAMVSREDIEVFHVDTDGVIEVFANEEDAKAAYEAAGAELKGGRVGKIGEVASPDAGAAWSEKAKAKLANVMEKAARVEMINRGEIFDGEDAEDQSGFVKINTNGPVTDQDEFEDAMGVVDESPSGDEENVMAKEFMALGVEQIQRARKDEMGRAVELVSGVIEANEAAQAEEKDAEEALKRYRQEALERAEDGGDAEA